MKILFVCTGNICRSPMAMVIFQNICIGKGQKNVKVAGAGTHAEFEATKEAVEALKVCGEKLPRKRLLATQFTERMLCEYDHIICMTQRHADYIGHHHANVKTLHEFADCGDIFDPYGYPLDIYIEVCKKLQNALSVLYNALFN